MNRRNRKLKKILDLSKYGSLDIIRNGQSAPFDLDADDIDLDAEYTLRDTPKVEMLPGQVWRLRGGGNALIIKKDDLGGFPRKEFTYFKDTGEDGFFRVDEYGRVGDDPTESDLIAKVSDDSNRFFPRVRREPRGAALSPGGPRNR